MKDRRYKLSDTQVLELRTRRRAGELLKIIAADFGVSLNYVATLCNHTQRARKELYGRAN